MLCKLCTCLITLRKMGETSCFVKNGIGRFLLLSGIDRISVLNDETRFFPPVAISEILNSLFPLCDCINVTWELKFLYSTHVIHIVSFMEQLQKSRAVAYDEYCYFAMQWGMPLWLFSRQARVRLTWWTTESFQLYFVSRHLLTICNGLLYTA